MFAFILNRQLNAVSIRAALSVALALSLVPTGTAQAELFWSHYRSWGWDDYGPFRPHHYRSWGWTRDLVAARGWVDELRIEFLPTRTARWPAKFGKVLERRTPGRPARCCGPPNSRWRSIMKTAKALGLKLSDNLLSLADEVIE